MLGGFRRRLLSNFFVPFGLWITMLSQVQLLDIPFMAAISTYVHWSWAFFCDLPRCRLVRSRAQCLYSSACSSLEGWTWHHNHFFRDKFRFRLRYVQLIGGFAQLLPFCHGLQFHAMVGEYDNFPSIRRLWRKARTGQASWMRWGFLLCQWFYPMLQGQATVTKTTRILQNLRARTSSFDANLCLTAWRELILGWKYTSASREW